MPRLRWLFLLIPVLAIPSAADEGPGRGVARISVLNGEVSLRRGDSGDLVAAAINAPMVVQDRLITGPQSRAEIQFDYSNMVRLTSNSEIRLSELEYRRYQLQLAQGTIMFRVLRDQESEVEISTPSVSVRPVKRGAYRVSVREDGTTEITVRSGEAEIFTPRGSERLKPGRTMLVRGTAADPEFQMVSEIRDDDWDRWNQSRDRDLERSRSYQYLSRDIYGADDLDHHGRWVQVDSYGWVWSPRVAVDWVPYRHGRWSWVDWYGWTWISYDPWGWAPYHYGRWFYSRPYGWCWYPGGFGRHYWSPALVAFVGFGRVGIGFGRVGWIPLGPHDPFHRWWGPRYYGGYRGGYVNNNITIVNNVNVNNVYRNARIVNAVTAVDTDGFTRGRSGNPMRLTDADFRQASVVQGQLPLAPARESLRLADRAPLHRQLEVQRDTFFSRRQAAAVDRVSFEDQRRGIEQAARTTFPDAHPGEGRGHQTAIGGAGAVRSTDPGGARGLDSARGAQAADTARSLDAANSAVTGRSGIQRGSDESSAQPAGVDRGNEWRRFGAPRAADVQGSEGAARGRSTGENGWRRLDRDAQQQQQPAALRTEDAGRRSDESWTRFGTPRTGSDSAPAAGSVRGDSSWRRMETPAGSDTGGRRTQDGWNRVRSARGEDRSARSDEAPRDNAPAGITPRTERRSLDNSDSIRISPPIVRERGDFGSRRGGDSAPAIRQDSAPRMDSGGGRVRGGDSGGSRPDAGSMRSGGGDGGGSRGGDGGGRGGRGR